MRHLFYVHSPITRLVAEAVIRHRELDPKRVYWLTDRGQQVQARSPRYMRDVSHLKWGPLRDTARNYANLRYLDEWVAGPSGTQRFTFYAPHHLTPTLQAVFSSPNCVRYCYLEEGIGAYATHAQQEAAFPAAKAGLAQRSANYLKYRGRIGTERVFYDPFDLRFFNAYGLHASVFPDLPRKTILPLPFPVDPRLAHYEHVLALGPQAEYRMYPADGQRAIIEALLRRLIDQGITELHIKFHPRQLASDGQANQLRALFDGYRDRIAVAEIDPSVSLESIAASSDAAFYTAASSAGFYALLCGNPVFSYANLMAARDARYAAILQRMPALFLAQAQFLALPDL